MARWAPIMRLLAIVIICGLPLWLTACSRETPGTPEPGRVTILYTGGAERSF